MTEASAINLLGIGSPAVVGIPPVPALAGSVVEADPCVGRQGPCEDEAQSLSLHCLSRH